MTKRSGSASIDTNGYRNTDTVGSFVRFATVAFALSLVGCQYLPNMQKDREMDYQRAAQADSEQALITSTQMVNDFSQIGYDSVLKRGGKLKYDHDRSLPVMQLDGYRSFVKGVRLESEGDISSIVVRTFPSKPGMIDQGDSSIVYPSFMLLDDRFQVLEDIVRPKVNLTRNFMGKYGMSSSFTVPGMAKKQAKYLVLYVAANNKTGVYHYCEGGLGMVRFNSASLPEYDDVDCHSLPVSLEGPVELKLE